MPRKRPERDLTVEELEIARDLIVRRDVPGVRCLPRDDPQYRHPAFWTTRDEYERPNGRRPSKVISEHLARAEAHVHEHGWRLARAVRYVVQLEYGASEQAAWADAELNRLTREQRAEVGNLLRAARYRRKKNKRR